MFEPNYCYSPHRKSIRIEMNEATVRYADDTYILRRVLTGVTTDEVEWKIIKNGVTLDETFTTADLALQHIIRPEWRFPEEYDWDGEELVGRKDGAECELRNPPKPRRTEPVTKEQMAAGPESSWPFDEELWHIVD